MNKIFLTMFLIASLMGCGALSTVDAGSSSKGTVKDGSTFISILNVPAGDGDNYRGIGKAGAFGTGNDVLNTVYGNGIGLALGHGKKNRVNNYVDSSSKNNPTGDFATPSGRVKTEKVSDNSGETQSVFGDWE